jgi:hypothetical protein
MRARFLIGLVANRPRPVRERPTRNDLLGIFGNSIPASVRCE